MSKNNNKSFLEGYTVPELAVLKQTLLTDFELFCRFAFRCQTGGKLVVKQHHKVMCEFAQKIIDGEITRACISIPPRHSKTAFFTVCLIARSYAGFHGSENIQTSFSENNVTTNAKDIVTILQHPDFVKLFGTEIVSNSQYKFTLNGGGECHNRTSKGALTGIGAGSTAIDTFSGGLIMDDMIKPDDASSKTVRTRTNNLYTETLSNRPNTPQVPQIMIMQRLDALDMIGYVLEGNSGEKWHYLNIPAVVTKNTGNKPYYDRLCQKYTHAIPYYYSFDIDKLIEDNLEDEYADVELKRLYPTLQDYKDATLSDRLVKGEAALWAAKKTLAYYKNIEQVKYKYFQCQYMGNPIQEGGSVFKGEWFNWYEGWSSIDQSDIEYIRIYVDTAMKAGAHNDRSVFTAWAKMKSTGDLYLIDGLADRWEAPELKKNFIEFYNKWLNTPKAHGTKWRLECAKVEDKASGTGLIQETRRLPRFNIIPIPRSRDKFSRANDCTPELAAGKVYLPKGALISQMLLDEAEAFTDNDSHAHDDIVDTMMDAIEDNLLLSGTKPNVFKNKIIQNMFK